MKKGVTETAFRHTPVVINLQPFVSLVYFIVCEVEKVIRSGVVYKVKKVKMIVQTFAS